MRSRRAIALGIGLALELLGCQRAAAPADIPSRVASLGPPNLVLILVDTLRADYTTPYGFAQDTSPELARWAERGVVFERVRAQSSWTKMSMASMLTSLWPRSHGIREAQDGLAEEAVTLPEVLRKAGYATYAVQTNGWLHQSFGFHQGFDRYMFPKAGGDPRLGQASLWPHADRVVEESQRLIDAHDRSRPFFLYLHFMDVHEYAAPPHLKTFGTDSRGAYLAAIRWVDDAVERVREQLADAGVLDRTLIVFAADHGETFGEHGVHGHARNVLTPVVWVPLVFRFPFPVEPPVRVPTQARNVDLAPTLLDLAGAPIPEGFEGRSLVPLMTGEADEPDRPTFAGLGVPLFPDASVQTAVSDGAWTYARNATPSEDDPEAYEGKAIAPGAEFLFDRHLDPGENANLVDREVAEAERMAALLDAHIAKQDEGVVEKGVRIDPSIAERLRAMGYLR
ncbi:MAG: sulfatase [Deltaproteobacteria bacterium]|nr:sulfatase [Deltaproteobacteria bacterium]MBW2395414.1 sulfatase [Deltaproteobacteria bacterium]